ncbi:MAG: hypothetical protein AVDCRST_MAG56-7855, partial [uncultured Cytophagales bacterium]
AAGGSLRTTPFFRAKLGFAFPVQPVQKGAAWSRQPDAGLV